MDTVAAFLAGVDKAFLVVVGTAFLVEVGTASAIAFLATFSSTFQEDIHMELAGLAFPSLAAPFTGTQVMFGVTVAVEFFLEPF
jgi:maltodextrin utilization protein YvdJ